MSIRAKFRCTSVVKYPTGDGETVRLGAVHGGASDANKSWSKFTPSGDLRLHITNPEAEGKFVPGNYYFLDFTETDKDG